MHDGILAKDPCSRRAFVNVLLTSCGLNPLRLRAPVRRLSRPCARWASMPPAHPSCAETTPGTFGHLWPDADESTRSAVGAVLAARMDSSGILAD